MKEWFKARNIWGAAFLSLSDAEAGRLAKALWQYTMTGEQPNLSGAEKASFALFQFTLSQDENEQENLSKTRANAGSIGGKQKQANVANANFATNEQANVAIDTNKNKIKNKDIKDNDNNARAEMPFGLTDEDIQVSLERDQQIEDTAKGAGLNTSEISMVTARRYADEYGLDKLLDAIKKTALNATKPSWAYVEGVLKGKGAKQNDGRGNYSSVQSTGGEKPSKYAHLFDDAV